MADWTEQAEQMLKTWTEAQKNVWDSWQDFAGRAVGAPSRPQEFATNPLAWFQQSMSAWTDPTGVARDAGRQVFGSQFSMMRNLEMLTNAWRMVAPKLDAGQDWRGALSGFTTDWFQQLAGAPHGLLETTKDTQALWQSYMKEWGPLLQPWITSAIEATGSGHLGEMMLGGSAGLSRLLTMEQDEFQGAPFGGLAEIPSIGVAREHQAKVLRAFDAFVDLRKVMLEFNQLTVGAMKQAVEAVIATLVEKSKKGEKIQSVRELNRLWLDSADDVFTKMYASEEYLKIQHEFSKAGMIYKMAQQGVVELALKGQNLPTRSELDDAYKTLYALRKEVNSLKKALKEQGIQAIAAAPPSGSASKPVAAKRTTKRTPAKKVSARKKAASRS
jgi:class III poly(R)-hydroxyalkanoic acid synthase PhaE subunit